MILRYTLFISNKILTLIIPMTYNGHFLIAKVLAFVGGQHIIPSKYDGHIKPTR